MLEFLQTIFFDAFRGVCDRLFPEGLRQFVWPWSKPPLMIASSPRFGNMQFCEQYWPKNSCEHLWPEQLLKIAPPELSGFDWCGEKLQSALFSLGEYTSTFAGTCQNVMLEQAEMFHNKVKEISEENDIPVEAIYGLIGMASVAAAGSGYGLYKGAKWLKNRRLNKNTIEALKEDHVVENTVTESLNSAPDSAQDKKEDDSDHDGDANAPIVEQPDLPDVHETMQSSPDVFSSPNIFALQMQEALNKNPKLRDKVRSSSVSAHVLESTGQRKESDPLPQTNGFSHLSVSDRMRRLSDAGFRSQGIEVHRPSGIRAN